METDSIEPTSQAMETEEVEVEVEEESEEDESIEASIARELALLKQARPNRKEWSQTKNREPSTSTGPKEPRVKRIRNRFESVDTKTECVVFISFDYPYDPVEITEFIIKELQETGISRTK